MTDDVIIQVEGLGKKYSIRHQRSERYTALRDVIAEKAKSFFRLPSGKRKVQSGGNGSPLPLSSSPSARASIEEFWALRNVNFEVKRGEVVGIIGRNGAGKSTLLKILSRITEPTEGRVRIRGRVASLLEVGTGFHPELTGRENIFLNGAILGMGRAEIKSKFDEIVDFAEIEKFLDTPVKRYSSGMYVRLAFAVAAHLEPEILVVDEVLAVGDAEFQKKCLGKMREVSRGGRTVLFVSHNLASITQLCGRGLVLRSGKIANDTTAQGAVDDYLKKVSVPRREQQHVLYVRSESEQGGNEYSIIRVEMLDEHGCHKSAIHTLDFIRFRIWFSIPSPIRQGSLLLEILSLQGNLIVKLETNPQTLQPMLGCGTHYADCCISSLPLLDGHYVLGVGLAIYGVKLLAYVPDAAAIHVHASATDGEMLRDCKGMFALEHSWHGESPEKIRPASE